MSYAFGRPLDCIVLYGPPGSGKGTHAQVLNPNKFFHISTGEIFRKDSAENHALGKKINAGGYAEDQFVITRVCKYIRDELAASRYFPEIKIVFDGFLLPKITSKIHRQLYFFSRNRPQRTRHADLWNV